jgi:hypothetical protein
MVIKYMRQVKLGNKEYEVEDYKDVIRPFITNIDIINFSKSNDNKIQKAFLKRLITIRKHIREKGVFEAKTCLFDRVFDAQKEDPYAIGLLKFVDEKIYNICSKLDKQLWEKFEDILVQLFINFDDKTSEYLARIGELAVLDKILMSKELILKDIEYKLSNGKCIDFAVQYTEQEESNDDEIVLLEVFNMHIQMEKVEEVNNLKLYFENRLLEKINIKLNGLDEGILNKFLLVPVFWGALDDFMIYADIFEWFNQYKPPISSPYGIFYCHLKSGERMYAFDTIENVAKRKINLTSIIR